MMRDPSKIRVVIGKVGLDGHTVGMFTVSKALSDAGCEVILAGIRLSPKEIVNIVVQEDGDVIGLSSLAGDHLVLFPKVARLLREANASHVLFIAGGIIPEEDIPILQENGIARVFVPGTPTDEIVEFVLGRVRSKHYKL